MQLLLRVVVTFEKVPSRNICHTYLSSPPSSFLSQRDFSIKNETTNEKSASSNSKDKRESNIARVEYSKLYTPAYVYVSSWIVVYAKQTAGVFSFPYLGRLVMTERFDFSPDTDRHAAFSQRGQ